MASSIAVTISRTIGSTWSISPATPRVQQSFLPVTCDLIGAVMTVAQPVTITLHPWCSAEAIAPGLIVDRQAGRGQRRGGPWVRMITAQLSALFDGTGDRQVPHPGCRRLSRSVRTILSHRGLMRERHRVDLISPRREQRDQQFVRHLHDQLRRLSTPRCYRQYGAGST
jgi:hypothetical protein